jgi:DNA end-binding protein Ku
MAARAMATGTISFGLVSIPVKLYSTSVTGAKIGLNWINPGTGARVRQRFWDPTTDEPVERQDLVKGYEFAKGQFVIFSEEELEEIVFKATHSIDIKEFVPLDHVDPIYFDSAYFLGTNTGGERPYKLLAQVMRDKNRAAIATYAARGKNYLVLLRPFEEGLIMQTLRYADELRAFDEVPVGDAEINDGELQLARQIVDQISVDEFRPEQYHDTQKERLEQIIARKIEGQEISATPDEEPQAQIIDLMEALKNSLASATGQKPGRSGRRKAAKRKTTTETNAKASASATGKGRTATKKRAKK